MISITKRKLLAGAALVAAAAAIAAGGGVLAGDSDYASAASTTGGLGQLSGLLPRNHLTEESAIQGQPQQGVGAAPAVPGRRQTERPLWYVLLDASDAGAAHDLGVNYAPKLAQPSINCPDCVQTVTLDSPTPTQNRFGQAIVHFKGVPHFSPTRIAEPGPTGFPLAKFQPGAVAGPGYSPFIRIAGAPTVYSAPIVATGDGPFDVVHHTNTGDRVLGIHIARHLRTGPVRRFVGRPAVREGVRRRPADHLCVAPTPASR